MSANPDNPQRELSAESEIEITTDMLRKGNAVLNEHYLGDGIYDLREETLREIFRVMYLSKP